MADYPLPTRTCSRCGRVRLSKCITTVGPGNDPVCTGFTECKMFAAHPPETRAVVTSENSNPHNVYGDPDRVGGNRSTVNEAARYSIAEWALGEHSSALSTLSAVEKLADAWAGSAGSLYFVDAADALRKALYGPVIAAEYRPAAEEEKP